MRGQLARYRQLYPDGVPSGPLNRPTSPRTTFSFTVDSENSSSAVSNKDSEQSGFSRSLKSTPSTEPLFPSSPARTPVLEDNDADFEPSDDEVSTRESLSGPFEKLKLYHDKHNFQGKSSAMMLFRAALDSRKEYADGNNHLADGRADTNMAIDKTNSLDVSDGNDSGAAGKRKEREAGTQSEEAVQLPVRIEYWNPPKVSSYCQIHEIDC
jgi:hypothetical protein